MRAANLRMSYKSIKVLSGEQIAGGIAHPTADIGEIYLRNGHIEIVALWFLEIAYYLRSHRRPVDQSHGSAAGWPQRPLAGGKAAGAGTFCHCACGPVRQSGSCSETVECAHAGARIWRRILDRRQRRHL